MSESGKIDYFLHEEDRKPKNVDSKFSPKKSKSSLVLYDDRLDYNWFKYDKLCYLQNLKMGRIDQLLEKERALLNGITNSKKPLRSSDNKTKKTILLLLNELKYQLSVQ